MLIVMTFIEPVATPPAPKVYEKVLSAISLRKRQHEANESALSERYTKNELPLAMWLAMVRAKAVSLHRPSSVNMATVTTRKVSTVLLRSSLNQSRKKFCNASTVSQFGLLKSGKTNSPNMLSK